MTRYLFRRALGTIPVVLLVTLLVYGLLHLAPGDPASLLLPEDATDADVAEARALGARQAVLHPVFLLRRERGARQPGPVVPLRAASHGPDRLTAAGDHR